MLKDLILEAAFLDPVALHWFGISEIVDESDCARWTIELSVQC